MEPVMMVGNQTLPSFISPLACEIKCAVRSCPVQAVRPPHCSACATQKSSLFSFPYIHSSPRPFIVTSPSWCRSVKVTQKCPLHVWEVPFSCSSRDSFSTTKATEHAGDCWLWSGWPLLNLKSVTLRRERIYFLIKNMKLVGVVTEHEKF